MLFTSCSPPCSRNSLDARVVDVAAQQHRRAGADLQEALDRVEVLQVLRRVLVERRRVRLEEEADVLAEQRIAFERGLRRGLDRRDRDLLVGEQPLLGERVERARVGEARRVGRVA